MSNTRMLSYEIDALVADRFKASWERMVLLASIDAALALPRPLYEPFAALVEQYTGHTSLIAWRRSRE